MMSLVLAFAQASFALMKRLKSEHTAMWQALGEPEPWRFASKSRLKFARFVYLSGEHRTLGDAMVTLYVYAIRATFIAFALGAASKMLGWKIF